MNLDASFHFCLPLEMEYTSVYKQQDLSFIYHNFKSRKYNNKIIILPK